MKRKTLSLLLALLCLGAIPMSAAAAETPCDAAYCFSPADFSESENFAGICITGLPEQGAVMLGNRIIRPGDILTAEQTSLLTYTPIPSEDNQTAQLTYLPIFSDRVEAVTTMAIAVFGKKDQAPVAEDSALETYKNLPNEGMLKASDPEGQPMTFTITRQPKRGTVTIREDGSFVYEPQKNKVGTDSFTYTAADPAGNVSREATVTITIIKPTDATQYTDTVDSSCRFAAEWMKNTGIFTAESIGGNGCFQPSKVVSRGEFVTMLVGALNLELDEEVAATGFTDDCAPWLKPYLAAAMRSGLMAGWIEEDVFQADTLITGQEAAAMIQNALDLAEPMVLSDGNLTRGEAAEAIYRVSQLKADAPGLAVLNTLV